MSIEYIIGIAILNLVSSVLNFLIGHKFMSGVSAMAFVLSVLILIDKIP